MAETEGSAAAGKVVFNVAASVRYPDQEAELQKLREAAAERQDAEIVAFNGRLGELRQALEDGCNPDHWGVPEVEPGVGLVIRDTRSNRIYNLTVTEAF
jgi:hypothetical protein